MSVSAKRATKSIIFSTQGSSFRCMKKLTTRPAFAVAIAIAGMIAYFTICSFATATVVAVSANRQSQTMTYVLLLTSFIAGAFSVHIL